MVFVITQASPTLGSSSRSLENLATVRYIIIIIFICRVVIAGIDCTQPLLHYSLRAAYDRNAIRVDNLRGDKVGHIKATMATNLAPIMDSSSQQGVRLEGTIPRRGNAYTVSVLMFPPDLS